MKIATRHLLLMILVTLAFTAAANACPMCKDSVPNSDVAQASSVPAALNNSVYFILISFLTVLTGMVTFIVRTIRQSPNTRPGGFDVIEK